MIYPTVEEGLLLHADGSRAEKISLEHQRRVSAGFLINQMGMDPHDVAQLVGFKRSDAASKWADRLARFGSVEDHGASRGPKRKLTDEQAALLGAELGRDKIGRGIERVAIKVQKISNLPDASRWTYARSMKRAGFDLETSVGDIPLDEAKEALRLAFCKRRRDDRLGYRCAFSDSKIFVGGDVFRQGRARMTWVRKGEPRRENRKKPAYQVGRARWCSGYGFVRCDSYILPFPHTHAS